MGIAADGSGTSSRSITPAPRPVNIVAVGVSTGGPNALCSVIPNLPADLPVPVVVVQHMPPVFTAQLADRLAGLSRLPVREAVSGEALLPGHVWIAPGDHHLVVIRHGTVTTLQTNKDAPENSCRPAADVLFRSVARVFGAHALAVVMTGMGMDGTRGCEAIALAGGQIIVQDQASSVVWSMPGSVVRAGLADKIVPLDGLADEIVSRIRQGRRTFGGGGTGGGTRTPR